MADMESSSGSQAVAKRSLESALMPPPPRPKRIKRPQKVLDEDTYTSALSHIIARDFFPGLVETESQQEYLDALDSQDEAWIASAGKRLREVMTPGPDGRRIRRRRGTTFTPTVGRGASQTPKGWGGDTPMSVAGSEMSCTTAATDREGEEVDTSLSLTAFQNKYTSEDNESFYKLLDKQNLKRAEKYAWMWTGNKIPSARQIAQRQRSDRLLSHAQDDDDDKQLTLTQPDTRPAMPDSWTSKPENEFMFAPDGIEDRLPTVQQAREDASRAPPKAVAYDNTRLPLPPPTSDAPSCIPPSPSLSAVADALAGRPRPTASEPGYAGSATPRVNGYAYVDEDEPEPPPSSASPSFDILGLGLDRDPSPNPFRIKDGSRREHLHHRMVERVLRNNRLKKADPDRTPTPRFASSPRVAADLTAAGRRLLGRVGTPARSGGGVGGAFDRGATGTGAKSGLGKAWTPVRGMGVTPTPTPAVGK